MQFQCPHCGSTGDTDENNLGLVADCPHCAKEFTIAHIPATTTTAQLAPLAVDRRGRQEVIIRGIEVPFWNWVSLIFTIALASIPALLAASVIVLLITLILGSLGG